MGIAVNIKLRRLELGMTQQQLAEAVGYRSRSAIAKIEAGTAEVPLSKLIPFARALDTTTDMLLEGMEDSAVPEGATGKTPIKLNRSAERRAAIILAGGRSTRNRQNIPNQFINILGKPVIGYCMETYQRHPMVDEICVVCLEGYHEVVEAYAKRLGIYKLAGIVPGGSSGVASVRAGLETLLRRQYRPSDMVIIQESTRPLVTEETITKVLGVASEKGSAVIGKAMQDNVQFFHSEDGSYSYLDRNRVIDLQSPDAYRISELVKIFRIAEQQSISDEDSTVAMMMYRAGLPLNFCEGTRENVKIIRQEDATIAAAFLKQRD